MPRKGTPQVQVSLSEEQRTVIEAETKRQGGKQAEWIRQALREYFEARGVKFPDDVDNRFRDQKDS